MQSTPGISQKCSVNKKCSVSLFFEIHTSAAAQRQRMDKLFSSGNTSKHLQGLVSLEVITEAEAEILRGVRDEEEYHVSVEGVMDAISVLSMETIKSIDEKAIDHYHSSFHFLHDSSGEVLHYSDKAMLFSWKKYLLDLAGTVLEYTKPSGRDAKAGVVLLTPECYVLDYALPKSHFSMKKHAFQLITPTRVYTFATGSQQATLKWVGSLARAILVPRKRSLQINSLKAFLYHPEGLEDKEGREKTAFLFPKNPASLNPQDLVVRGAQISSGKHVKRYVVLKWTTLYMFRDEASMNKHKHPLAVVVLNHRTQIRSVTPTTLKISVPLANAKFMTKVPENKREISFDMEFPEPDEKQKDEAPDGVVVCKEWRQALEQTILSCREVLEKYVHSFHIPYNAKPPRGHGPIKQLVEQQQSQVEVTGQGDKETDNRPMVHVRICFDETTMRGMDRPVGVLRVSSFDEKLVVVRDEIFRQLEPDVVPAKFSFLNTTLQDGQRALYDEKRKAVNHHDEESVALTSCLVRGDGNVLLLSCPEHLVRPSYEDPDLERNAYLLEVKHLETQLARQRRVLFERESKAALVEVKEEKSSGSPKSKHSAVYNALKSLQKDGFLSISVKLLELESKYLELFTIEDATRIFAENPSCPLRCVFRALVADPERVLAYVEDLERFVLIPYNIRIDRLLAPYWALSVLRNTKFHEDSSRFELWARDMPWLENDQERYVFHQSRLLNGVDVEEYQLLKQRKRPLEPIAEVTPSIKKTPTGSSMSSFNSKKRGWGEDSDEFDGAASLSGKRGSRSSVSSISNSTRLQVT